jgi:hypothetical protein
MVQSVHTACCFDSQPHTAVQARMMMYSIQCDCALSGYKCHCAECDARVFDSGQQRMETTRGLEAHQVANVAIKTQCSDTECSGVSTPQRATTTTTDAYPAAGWRCARQRWPFWAAEIRGRRSAQQRDHCCGGHRSQQPRCNVIALHGMPIALWSLQIKDCGLQANQSGTHVCRVLSASGAMHLLGCALVGGCRLHRTARHWIPVRQRIRTMRARWIVCM